MSSSSVLQSSLITILVGPEEAEFTAHQDVLTKYPYFRGCLGGGFPEGQSKTIKMPEDDPTTFARVLEFIYFGTIPYNLDEKFLSPKFYHAATRDEQKAWSKTVHTASRGLIKVYRLADKLCIESLMNASHDSCRRIHENYNIAVEQLPTMTENVPDSDKLRQFAVKQMAWYVKEFGWSRAKDELPDIWSKFMEKSSENAIELFEAYTTLKAGKNSRRPALWKRDKCQWHVHIDTPRCK
jgi:hypothetical protein